MGSPNPTCGSVYGGDTGDSKRLLVRAQRESPPALASSDMLGRWKPEGSDTYIRSYGGRVARLQATFAEAARSRDREGELDEREIAAGLGSWLLRTRKLAQSPANMLRRKWANERIVADPLGPWAARTISGRRTARRKPAPAEAATEEG